MTIEHWPEGVTKWKLDSGWYVNPENSLDFTAPDGVIYDRCEWLLVSRSQHGRQPASLHLTDIFTDEEFELYAKQFD